MGPCSNVAPLYWKGQPRKQFELGEQTSSSGKAWENGENWRIASSQERLLISLKRRTGKRKSLENSMKVWLRNLTPGQDQITRSLQCPAFSDFTLQAIGKQVIFLVVTRSDHSSGPRKDRLASGSLRTGKQAGRRLFQEPRAHLLQRAFSEPTAKRHCEMSLSTPRTSYIPHSRHEDKYVGLNRQGSTPCIYIFPDTAQNLPGTHLLNS